MNTDVLVIGGGNAALCAALMAAEAGARVTLLEAAPRAWRGGNSAHTRNLRCMHDAPQDVLVDAYPEEEFWQDLLKVTGGITVRRAADGELLKTLDGVERKLVADDLVIADGNGPVALAGVMGGGNSEISTETKRVFLEVAYFDPRGVRRTGRRHGLHTESSHRFERGVDWSDTGRALARAQELLSWLDRVIVRGEAVVTLAAYFASTPRRYRGFGRFHLARRSEISFLERPRVRVRVTASMRVRVVQEGWSWLKLLPSSVALVSSAVDSA